MEKESAATRTRILEAAAMVFAEHGFAATTVRQICGKAKVNLAAVNYHFGGKENLYRESIRYARLRAYERFPISYGLADDATPEEKLQAYVRSFLLRTSSDERNLGFGTLVMREMVEPTSALDMLVDEGIRSLVGQLVALVRPLLGASAEEELILACSRSILSQCIFFLFSRSVISRMSPEDYSGFNDVDKISAQIMAFSMSALRGLTEKSPAEDGI
jgi:TetR/AcrR family transcriptional regulator, regulator of cefoperazone and chloramphenicol sensitivity